ncbi:SMI1/KNR4 family protein [Nonomuraea maheshkhaliensis]|uniref:SMI1/KNR4 family protein n=1 Tax=Nonomuraea maheshkhaliensis TaxID=419590 RepID=UPI0031F77F1E
MLKLVRLALTAAILTAIAVRLRRRARLPRKEPAAPVAPARRARRTGMGAIWAGIVAIVALTLVLALMPAGGWQARAAYEESLTWDEVLATVPDPVPPTADSAVPPAVPPAVPLTVPPTVPPVTPPAEPTARSVPSPAASARDSGLDSGSGCAPAPRPVTVRPIDPVVKRAVDRQWWRIERWLKANAPRTYLTLRAPGKARTIAVAEAQMGLNFPDDLRASLLRHNGSRGAGAFGLGLGARSGVASHLGIRQIRDTWRRLCASEAGSGRWNGRMIPFLSRQGRGSDATEHAVTYAAEFAAGDPVDRAVAWEGTDGMLRVPSYHALMRAVADALEQGTALTLDGEGESGGRRPTVERGLLRWK